MNKRALAFILLFALCSATANIFDVHYEGSAGAATADEWPMLHHDAAHSGYSTSTAPTTNHILWNASVGGSVHSSPTVANGRVFVPSYSSTPSGGRTFTCLDAATGSQLWSYGPAWGVYSAAAVVDGKVYVGSEGNGFFCLNAVDGTLIWNSANEADFESSPAIVEGRVYVGGSFEGFYCLDAATGAQLWRYDTGGLAVWSSPAVVDGKVYFCSDRHMVYCVNATTGILIWSNTIGSPWSSPTVVNGKVYLGSEEDSKTYCLDATTGAVLWSYGIESTSSVPAVTDGRIYVDSADGKLYCLNADSGEFIWSYATGDGACSSPAVADGKVYVGSGDYTDGFNPNAKIYCLNATNGAKIWSYTTSYAIRGSPAIANGTVYIATEGGKVYAFNGGPPIPEGDNIIFIHADGSIEGSDKVQREGNVYVFTGNVSDPLVVERDGIVVDGAGHKIESVGAEVGVFLIGRSNVTVKNLTIKGFNSGVYLRNSSSNTLYENYITNNDNGIDIVPGNPSSMYSYNNMVFANNITGNSFGIRIWGCHSNTISGNTITDNADSGIYFVSGSHNNSISENNISGNHYGIAFGHNPPAGEYSNSISANKITNNYYGIFITGAYSRYGITGSGSSKNRVSDNYLIDNSYNIYISSSENRVYNNNFIRGTFYNSGANVWDDGYPSGGNYWSTYSGVDFYSGPNQNETGSDGIGDTNYQISVGSDDRYPLMGPISTFNCGTYNNKTYIADIVSNSVISAFSYDATQKRLSFNVDGSSGTSGFCKITLDNALLDAQYYRVTVDETQAALSTTINGTYSSLYFTYTHSAHNIKINGTDVPSPTPSPITPPTPTSSPSPNQNPWSQPPSPSSTPEPSPTTTKTPTPSQSPLIPEFPPTPVFLIVFVTVFVAAIIAKKKKGKLDS